MVYDWLESTNVSDTKADAAEWDELEADEEEKEAHEH
jgi:hypothetical protein